MGKLRSFLRFFVCCSIAFLTNVAVAGSYSCPTYKVYTTCNANHYLSKKNVVGNSCIPCPTGATTPDNNTSLNCTCPDNYWNFETGKNTVVAGQTCSIKNVTCAKGTYLKDRETSCTPCPAGKYCPGGTYTASIGDQGATNCPAKYPNSDAGSSAITNCYSNEMKRPWTGKPAKCDVPSGCSTAECFPCIQMSCAYVAYSNSTGTGDGEIKSGCKTNDESCTPVRESVTAAENHYVTDTSCVPCPRRYPYSDEGNTGGQTACYTPCTVSCTVPTCPDNAECNVIQSFDSGIQHFGGSCVVEQSSTCKFTFTCNAGYTKTADGHGCQPETYTITYNPGPGAQSESGVTPFQEVAYQSTFTPRSISDIKFKKPGFTFAGWSGSYSDPNKEYTYFYTNSISVEAQWNACSEDVHSNGQCDCAPDEYPNGNGCSSCIISCSDVSSIFKLGSYNICADETDAQCYRKCTTDDVSNSAAVSGEVYNDKYSNNVCLATLCKTGYYLNNHLCSACPTNAICDGTGTYSCKNGYKLDNGQCVGKTYTITFDANSGIGGPNPITLTYGDNVNNLSTSELPTRANFVFIGYFDDKTNGVQYYTASGTPISKNWSRSDNFTLYAHWTEKPSENCQAGKFYNGQEFVTCPSGMYCPGTDTVYQGSEGCAISCTTLGNGFLYSEAGATRPSDCYKNCDMTCTGEDTSACQFPMVEQDCVYNTEAPILGVEHYNDSGSGVSLCEFAEDTDATCPLSSFTCATRYYHNGTGCSPCTDLADGSFSLSINRNKRGPGVCYKACSRPCDQQTCPPNASCTHGSTVKNGGYYYDNPDLCTAAYSSCSITINCFDNYTLNTDTAQCDPNIYTITLNNGDDAGGNSVVYEKYATGWFSDSGANTAISKATPPTRDGWTFLGYYTEQTGGSRIIADSGVLPASTTFSANTTLYAHWSQNSFDCQAGKYYNGMSFVDCPAGKYCPGTGTVLVNQTGCDVPCPENGSSPNGATVATECFVACPAPATIKNGVLGNTQTQQNWTGTEYPACTFTAICNTGYKPVNSPGLNPTCAWADPTKCPEGYYCSNGGDPIACPNGGSSELGSTSITDCYKIFDNYSGTGKFEHGVASVKCNYSNVTSDYTICSVRYVKRCDAGYWYKTNGSLACEGTTSGYYSPDGDIVATQCPRVTTGGVAQSTEHASSYSDCYKQCITTVEHAKTVAPESNTVNATSATEYAGCAFNVTCDTGYTVADNNTANPTCDANEYTITLDKNGGNGSLADSIKCTYNSGRCPLPKTTELTRTGYSVGEKWCSTATGGAPCYDAGTIVTTNISATGEDTKLYAIWTPNVYTLNLDDMGAQTAAQPQTAYLKYATGWFANATTESVLTTLTTIPVKAGYTFSGYYTEETAGTQVIGSNGAFVTSAEALTAFSSDWTAYARWAAGSTTCDAGTYYTGHSTVCAQCEENHYCPGATFGVDSGHIDGRFECSDSGLAPAGSASEGACYKTGLAYAATNGKGTQRCFYDDVARTYSANCDTQKITACNAGYWLEDDANIDCVAVGNGYYSANTILTRDQCPNGGTTDTQTAVTVQECYKHGVEYIATYGNGTQRCFYSTGDGDDATYARDCDTKKIEKCRGGYWLEQSSDIDCVATGLNYYSPTDETTRYACPGNGQTRVADSESIKLCFKAGQEYSGEHGRGVRVCFYSSGTGDNAIYSDSCETPTMTYCDAGYYSASTQNPLDCIPVGIGHYSVAGNVERDICPDNGITDTETSGLASDCYMTGMSCAIENGTGTQTCKYNGTDAYSYDCTTCAVTSCDTGFSQVGNTCTKCPADNVCANGEQKTCSELTNGEFTKSDIGTTSKDLCYKDCAMADNATTMQGRDYYGIADTCEIATCASGYNLIDGACVETSCQGDYEMVDGRCVPCNRPHALTYDKNVGNCNVTSCEIGYHPYGQSCEQNIKECRVPNAVSAQERWDERKMAFGPCTVIECESGYHIAANTCVSDVQPCTVKNGTGVHEWNHDTNKWNACVATSCNPGYTNDPSETNDANAECGRCANMFGVNGERAASSYVRGCEIASCMYQGEIYNLENNECKPICTEYSDDTGTRKRVGNKCVSTCNAGYTAW